MALHPDEMKIRFTYHAPQPGQQAKYTAIRDKARELAELISASCPTSREELLAITALEECVMWANAAIARRSPKYVAFPTDPPYGPGCTLADHEDPPGGDIHPHWHCTAFESGGCIALHPTEEHAQSCLKRGRQS